MVWVAGVTLLLSLGDVCGNHLVFETVFLGGGVSAAWSKLQHVAVDALQLVGVARHIGVGTHEAHVADEHVPQLGQFIQFVMTQLGAQWGDAAIAHNHQSCLPV